MKTNSAFWSRDEDATLIRMDAAGASALQIAEALPGRSKLAVNKRRQVLTAPRPRIGTPTTPAPLGERVLTLQATIERARRDRKAKAYIKELRTGLIMLRYREQERKQ